MKAREVLAGMLTALGFAPTTPILSATIAYLREQQFDDTVVTWETHAGRFHVISYLPIRECVRDGITITLGTGVENGIAWVDRFVGEHKGTYQDGGGGVQCNCGRTFSRATLWNIHNRAARKRSRAINAKTGETR